MKDYHITEKFSGYNFSSGLTAHENNYVTLMLKYKFEKHIYLSMKDKFYFNENNLPSLNILIYTHNYLIN